jgi:hypothetical protein
MSYKAAPIRFAPTLNPDSDETNQNTVGIIDAQNIRFFRGGIEKMGGWSNILLNKSINGKPRSILTFERSNKIWTIIGTHTKLYARRAGQLYNITPLVTVATATLGSNPLAVVNTTPTITVTYTAHGLAVGDKIKLSGASDTGGILAAAINKEHVVVTTPTANTFTITAATNATSTVSGGGSAIDIFKEIAAGEADANSSYGAWIGTPWNTSINAWVVQADSSLLTIPRVWWQATFGDTWVGGTGNGGGVYKWEGDETVSASLIANAPNANWGWVEDARLCLLKGNIVYNSATGDFTSWTPSSSSSAYEDAKEDAINLISQINVGGINYVFDEYSNVFTLRWVGGSVKWVWQQINNTVGIIAPYARVERGGIVYFMGQDNIYYMNGSIIEPLPNNALYKYIYDDIKTSQKRKCFMWYNAKFDEIWGHYPSGGATENDRCFIFNLKEATWNRLTSLDRTAYDRAGEVFETPLLASSSGVLYQHEVGYNDGSSAMDSWFQVSYQAIDNGKYYTEIEGMELDAILTGNMTISLFGKHRQNQIGNVLASFNVTENTQAVDCIKETRYLSWKFESNVLNGYFRVGGYRQFINRGGEF